VWGPCRWLSGPRLCGVTALMATIGRWVANARFRGRRRWILAPKVLQMIFRVDTFPVADLPAPLWHPTPDVRVRPGALGRGVGWRWLLSRGDDGRYWAHDWRSGSMGAKNELAIVLARLDEVKN
jgi:hypothetical protein